MTSTISSVPYSPATFINNPPSAHPPTHSSSTPMILQNSFTHPTTASNDYYIVLLPHTVLSPPLILLLYYLHSSLCFPLTWITTHPGLQLITSSTCTSGVLVGCLRQTPVHLQCWTGGHGEDVRKSAVPIFRPVAAPWEVPKAADNKLHSSSERSPNAWSVVHPGKVFSLWLIAPKWQSDICERDVDFCSRSSHRPLFLFASWTYHLIRS